MARLGSRDWYEAVSRLHGALHAVAYRLALRNPTGRSRLDLLFDARGWRDLRREGADPENDDRLRFFDRTRPLPADRVERLLADLPGAPDAASLEAIGILERTPDGAELRSCLRFFPTGAGTVVSDSNHLGIEDFVYIGADSRIFAERLRRGLRGRRFARALDLCSGSGVQGLTIAPVAGRVEGSDLNPRAVAFANLNARLHGVSERVHFEVANLAEGFSGPYDLVVANPPFVWLEPELRTVNLHAHGGELGLEVSERILRDLDRLLAAGGEARMIAESPVVRGGSALVSLARRVLEGSGLGAELTLIRHRAPRAYQRQQGCSHVDYFDVRVARDLSPTVRVRTPPWPVYAASLAYHKLSKRTRGRPE